MAQRVATVTPTRAPWFGHAWRMVAAIASTGAALASLISALYSYGVVGRAESHQALGNLGAAWVGLQPNADTAFAIGDTIHLAATITDRSGSILVGAHPTWTSDDPRVASVVHDGSVIAQAPGATMVAVVVGSLVAHSRIVVAPRPAAVSIVAVSLDSAVTVAEDARLALRAVARDARGHAIAGLAAQWHIDDTTVAGVDSTGLLAGRSAGRSIVTARIAGVVGHAAVTIVATPAAIATVAGAGQRAAAGRALPQPVVVRVMSRRGRPIEGQLVTFRAADGLGSPAPDTARTDADGRARTTWSLGDLPGSQQLLASVEHVDSMIAIVAEADPIASNVRISSLVDAPSSIAGTMLADTVGIRVTDSTGRALGGVPVTWTALDGSVQALDARTDSRGQARVRWKLAKRLGAQRLRVQVGAAESAHAVAPFTIVAMATAGAPASLVVVSGNDQHAKVGAALARSIAVRVVDRNGNGVSDATLVLAPSAGAVPDATIRSDSMGVARIHWTMGRTTGMQSMAIHIDGVTRLIRVSARAVPDGPDNLSFDDSPATRHAGSHAAKRLVALVTDVYGNPVPDTRVQFSTKFGSVSPARAVTDSRGRVAVAWVTVGHASELTLTGVVRGTDVRGTYVMAAGTAVPHGPSRQRR